MADTPEGLIPPPALDQKGNTTIWWVPNTGTGGSVPGIADVNAIKAATELGATGAKRITFSFTPGGFKFAGAQGTVKDERLGLSQPLESLDTNDVTLDLEYVESSDAGSANMVLTPGSKGFFVIRTSTPNQTVAAASQTGRAIYVTLGAQNLIAPDNTGKFRIAQKAALNAVVGPVSTFVA